ncbi:MAG TPA: hypothetical protein VK824_04495 [Planctomycetota bacterium]|nr:hypothetical protein [Planctomycetota bacterium]
MRASRVLCHVVLLCAACSAPRGTYITPEELAARERAAAAAPAADGSHVALAAALSGRDRSGLSPERQAQRDGFDGRAIALSRRREDGARTASELGQKRARVALEQASSSASEEVAAHQAEREQRIAGEDLRHFNDVEEARRLAESALELRGSADNLLETREELAQLEMMYKDSDLGDATAEIVLNRTRRRLQRAEDGHHLREARAAELKSITLPRDRERLNLELAAKTVGLENARRAAEQGRMQREQALRDLEFEGRKQAREQEDIVRDESLLQKEIERWERQLATENAAAAPAGAAGAPGGLP